MKKGLKTLIVGILLFAVGTFVVPIAFILPIILDGADERQFIIPGTTEVEISEPGRYYLWNDFQTVYSGKSYSRSNSIPDGLEITITKQDGEGLAFSSDTSISSSSGSSSKNSIGYVEVSSPCKLTVSVLGNSDKRVFSFSQSGLMKMFGLIFGGFGLSMLLAISGAGISIWGIVKLVKNDKKSEPDGVVNEPGAP
ncbi:hypothetical protein [Cerasicoccus arenae]|uniref:Uncharacterized protein n=1 Tax=Cerasicoccus arenae TaxID=424488 RepID=A0A8J3DFF5_9BACT|nr:hypothetical protein [Cerasicoccus arenae]MBK1857136.1 hypothetical protein [Cerasicoccus arenae]GHB92575.1 hypothetical protein GCM10007047_04680 [Cerasicoccus arenae]